MGLPRRKRIIVSPCSTSVMKLDAFFLKSVKETVFIARLLFNVHPSVHNRGRFVKVLVVIDRVGQAPHGPLLPSENRA